MNIRELNRMALCFIGLVCVPAGMLFAQQTEAERAPAEQPNPPYSSRVGYRLVEGITAGKSFPLDGGSAWRLVTATYGNQLGVEIAELDGALRAQLGIEEGTGVLVTGVSPESESAKALLVQHDIILKIGDQTISGTKQFNDLIGTLQGKTAQFRILRKGKPAELLVTLPKAAVYQLLSQAFDARAVPEVESVAAAVALAYRNATMERHYRIGVTLAEADDVLRSQLRLAAGEGLVVTEVLADSPAEKAGIQRHDVLTKLDGKRLTDVDAANAQIQEIKDRSVSVALCRAGNEIVVTVTPRLTEEPAASRLILNWEHQQLGNLIRLHEVADSAFLLREFADSAVLLQEFNVRGLSTEPSPHPTAAAQLAELKKQLADLQKSLEGLEAALQSESANKPQPPAEPK